MNKVKTWSEFYGKDVTSLRMFLGNFYSTELFEEMTKFNPKKILEVGSGTGVMSILLSHLGYDVTSIDNDRTVLKKAEKNNMHYNGKVNFEFADAFKLPYKNKSFDISYSQGLFEHFSHEDIKKLLDEQIRVTKKAVIISVPNKNYPEYDIGNEKLYSGKKWENLIRKLSGKKVHSFDYQYLLRKNKPFKTVWNMILNRKVLTVVTVVLLD